MFTGMDESTYKGTAMNTRNVAITVATTSLVLSLPLAAMGAKWPWWYVIALVPDVVLIFNVLGEWIHPPGRRAGPGAGATDEEEEDSVE